MKLRTFEEYTENKITCDNCGWQWKPQDGGDDMFICHECGYDNEKKLNETMWKTPGGNTPSVDSPDLATVNVKPLSKGWKKLKVGDQVLWRGHQVLGVGSINMFHPDGTANVQFYETTTGSTVGKEGDDYRMPTSELFGVDALADSANPLAEEWSTGGVEGTNWSFLPEIINSLLTPNFASNRPPIGNLNVEGETSEVDLIKREQKLLSEADKEFIRLAETDLPFCFYKWLSLRGEKPTMSEIKKSGMSKAEKKEMKARKKDLARIRPYQKWPEIKNLTEVEQESFSLPSGHTVSAHLTAERLSEKYPHLREGLFALAHKISTSRVQGGVHYPSDIEAGKALAKSLLAR